MQYMDIKPEPKTAQEAFDTWKNHLTSILRSNSIRKKDIEVLDGHEHDFTGKTTEIDFGGLRHDINGELDWFDDVHIMDTCVCGAWYDDYRTFMWIEE